MGDEHDSWLKAALGIDIDDTIRKAKDEASNVVDQAKSTVTQVVQNVERAVEGAIDKATNTAAAVVKKVASAVSPANPSSGGSGSGGGTGSFPLTGSVGRGGKNAPSDVRAVQTALGVEADGKCGPQTISAIESFQRSLGQARPDGRVDPGGATERALAGGANPTPPPVPDDNNGPLSTIDDSIRKIIDDAAAAFTPVVKLPNLGDFDMAASLSQAANQVVANNAPKLPLLTRGEALVEEARRILDANISPEESLDLPAPTIRFSGKCCSADELQRFRIAIEAPRTALQGSINAFKDADRAVAEACEQGKRICYGALAVCLVGTGTNPQAGVAACIAGAIACIGGSAPVQNAIRAQAKAEADLAVANGALERALANYRNAFVSRCDKDPPRPPGVP